MVSFEIRFDVNLLNLANFYSMFFAILSIFIYANVCLKGLDDGLKVFHGRVFKVTRFYGGGDGRGLLF